eukprot:jgi/Psemu1/297789/fgenesh1_pm.366_\
MCSGDRQNPNQKKSETPSSKNLSLRDFLDPTNPWDLRDRLPGSTKIRKWFSFVPQSFQEGQWLPITSLTILFTVGVVIYVTIDANMKFQASNTGGVIMENYVGKQSYTAFTIEWYYNVVLCAWMNYFSWIMYRNAGFGPWVSFTMCSWTITTIRHGLCSIAPFLPSARLLAGMMRFPVLLSASATFGIWNFVLMPAIALGFLKGKRRMNFLRWSFSWKLCQIHVFNILYAYLNAVWAEPKAQPLHLGDVNAAVIYILAYLSFYYLILDRIGIHLYPIFSPRTYICIPSLILTAGVCIGIYRFWNHILSGEG